MASARKLSTPKDQEIYEAHRRYVQVMEELRLVMLSDDTKTHYLAILRSVTEKLAIPSKPLSEVVAEMMAEAAPLLFQAMQR